MWEWVVASHDTGGVLIALTPNHGGALKMTRRRKDKKGRNKRVGA